MAVRPPYALGFVTAAIGAVLTLAAILTLTIGNHDADFMKVIFEEAGRWVGGLCGVGFAISITQLFKKTEPKQKYKLGAILNASVIAILFISMLLIGAFHKPKVKDRGFRHLTPPSIHGIN